MKLLSIDWEFPKNPQNLFGAERKYDRHTGIDIFAPVGTIVYPLHEGKVVQIGWFTGANSVPPSPWWNDTKYVIVAFTRDIPNPLFGYIEAITDYALYGELEPLVEVGQLVDQQTELGVIQRVLKNDKGNPVSMLHFEMYRFLPEHPMFWYKGEPCPHTLLNPTSYLKSFL